jgi:hypothetical protein
MAELYSSGNKELKQQFIDNIHKRIENKINNSSNPLSEKLDSANQAIVDYLKIQADIKNQLSKTDFITNQFEKQQALLNIEKLRMQAEDKVVLIHDTINSINSNIYIAKAHVQEAIEELRRNGNNITDSLYKYIEDFNN